MIIKKKKESSSYARSYRRDTKNRIREREKNKEKQNKRLGKNKVGTRGDSNVGNFS